jgi:hypothetical protein
MTKTVTSLTILLATAATAVPALTAQAASSYQIRVTCDVPRAQPERQLATNSCLNYIPDGTQTFVAHVTTSNGRPAAGVTVRWTESDSKDAHFRLNQNPCVTNASGICQAEVKDTNPQRGEKITITATAGGSPANGYLTFK